MILLLSFAMVVCAGATQNDTLVARAVKTMTPLEPVCFENIEDANQKMGKTFIKSGNYFIGYKENEFEVVKSYSVGPVCQHVEKWMQQPATKSVETAHGFTVEVGYQISLGMGDKQNMSLPYNFSDKKMSSQGIITDKVIISAKSPSVDEICNIFVVRAMVNADIYECKVDPFGKFCPKMFYECSVIGYAKSEYYHLQSSNNCQNC